MGVPRFASYKCHLMGINKINKYGLTYIHCRVPFVP